jgi:hypothetical protein
MRSSYADVLRSSSEHTVDNFSIGGSPNIVILDVVLKTDLRNYDYIILETAVVDALHGPSGIYPADIALQNLRLGVRCIRDLSSAKLLLLVLPTQIGLLEPEHHTSENIHLQVAEEFQIPVLNMTRLFREWIGNHPSAHIQRLSAWAPVIADSFEIPRSAAYDLSWTALKQDNNKANLFAMTGFVDSAHVARSVHRLMGEILLGWIERNIPVNPDGPILGTSVAARRIDPVGLAGQREERESSLIKRTLTKLSDGESVTFPCPNDYIAAGILFNRSRTSAFVEFNSPAGSVTLDCRFYMHALPWIAVISPIIDTIGSGDITLTIRSERSETTPYRKLADTDDGACSGTAEIGELIVIRRDMPSLPVHSQIGERGALAHLDIGAADWAQVLCRAAHQSAADVFEGIAEMSTGLTKGLSSLFLDTLMTNSDRPSCVGCARSLLLLGRPRSALKLLFEAGNCDEEEHQLDELRQKLTSFLGTLERPSSV